MSPPKHIALVHDWLVTMRGGERVLEALCELFPDARLFTLVHAEGKFSPPIDRIPITTSVLQRLPFGVSHYQYYLPLFPLVVRSLDVRDFDMVISSSSAVAKAVRVREDALHICYCHTPMRYLWDQYDQYFGKGRASLPTRLAMGLIRNYLRRWDVETASRVHHFIANSRYVQQRIKRIYQRDSDVIYPPVDVQRFSVSTIDEGYYLIVSALVPYKRVDIAVQAFNVLGDRLVIIGAGSEEKKLKAMAKSNIEFLGKANDDTVKQYYERCKALIFSGEEDFGIVPVEAMASGKPVIAFDKGGVCETVLDGVAGILYPDQTAVSLQGAVKVFEKKAFDRNTLRAQAEKFDRGIFKSAIERYIISKWEHHHAHRKQHP